MRIVLARTLFPEDPLPGLLEEQGFEPCLLPLLKVDVGDVPPELDRAPANPRIWVFGAPLSLYITLLQFPHVLRWNTPDLPADTVICVGNDVKDTCLFLLERYRARWQGNGGAWRCPEVLCCNHVDEVPAKIRECCQNQRDFREVIIPIRAGACQNLPERIPPDLRDRFVWTLWESFTVSPMEVPEREWRSYFSLYSDITAEPTWGILGGSTVTRVLAELYQKLEIEDPFRWLALSPGTENLGRRLGLNVVGCLSTQVPPRVVERLRDVIRVP